MAKWKLDPAHSTITFKIKHLMISNVKGSFKTFDAEIDSQDDNFEDATVTATVDLDSIDTNNADRDAHLKTNEFFDMENHPQLKFTANSLSGDVEGEITIKGVTKPIKLNVDFGGITKDPWGNTKAGFSFDGKISRKEFGITYNPALETGGVVVGDEVKISGDLEFMKQ